jgi:hypothetical protein
MSRAPVTRLLVNVGWAVSLLILPVFWSGPAQACVIFARSSVVVSTIYDECAVGPMEEDGVWDRDQTVLADDDLAPSNLFGFVLWSPSENRSQLLAVNDIAGRRSRSTVSSIGADVLEKALSNAADDPGPGGVPAQQAGSDPRVALAGPNIKQANDRQGLPDDVLWQAAKYLARHYDVISPDGDVAAIVRLGIEAIHAIDHYSTISLGDTATTGLGAANRYQSISLAGDAVATGLQETESRRAGVGGSFHEVGRVAYYLAAAHSFLFSRNALIAGLIIMVAYIAIAGLQSLIRTIR